MNIKQLFFCIFMVSFSSQVFCEEAEHGSERDDKETFPQQKDGATQILLGAGDVAGFIYTVHMANVAQAKGVTMDSLKRSQVLQAKQTIEDSQEALKKAQNLVTDIEKGVLIEKAHLDLTLLQQGTKEYVEVQKKLVELKAIEAVSSAKKLEQLEQLGQTISKARMDLIVQNEALWLRGGKLMFKYAKVVGASLFVVDFAGRIYVWNSMSEDPTLSPVVTFSVAKLSDGFDFVAELGKRQKASATGSVAK